MTKIESKAAGAVGKDILLSNPDGLHEAIRAMMQEVLTTELRRTLMPCNTLYLESSEVLPIYVSIYIFDLDQTIPALFLFI
jgi:hypothetical protein